VPNVFTYFGYSVAIDALRAKSFWLAWGTGAGSQSTVADTRLFSETGSRVAVQESLKTVVTTSQPGDTLQLGATLTWASPTPGQITNVGVCMSATTNTPDVIAKTDFPGIPLEEDDYIVWTVKLQAKQAAA